jgi:CHAT domain-containing protein
LATHGQFSSNADNTFILTWDGRINVKQLDQLLRSREGKLSPIELLVLSACQTATGDKRAALGMAGVAVRSGARSTLASLWSVSDRSTAFLMIKFYRELGKPEITKAEALRRAQVALLHQDDYTSPYYWAPFVLLGNWL